MFFLAVYEAGSVFDPAILDITDDDLLKRFMQVSSDSEYNLPELP